MTGSLQMLIFHDDSAKIVFKGYLHFQMFYNVQQTFYLENSSDKENQFRVRLFQSYLGSDQTLKKKNVHHWKFQMLLKFARLFFVIFLWYLRVESSITSKIHWCQILVQLDADDFHAMTLFQKFCMEKVFGIPREKFLSLLLLNKLFYMLCIPRTSRPLY